jgi:adenylate cyclase
VPARRQWRVALALIAAAAAALGVMSYAFSLFEGAELDTVDTRFALRGERKAPDDIVVVAIDARTLTALRERWPIRRSLHGELIRRLTKAGVKTIAYDVQFTEPTDPDEDNALIDAVAAADGVVLATSEVDARGNSNVFGGEDVVRDVGARAGNTLIDSDTGGEVRRVQDSLRHLETFAVVTAETATGKQVDPGRFEDGGAWIDYRGKPGTFDTVSFVDVLRGRIAPARLKGRIAVVGVSVPTVQDVHATPVGGGLMPGAEVQANAIATVLDDLPLRSAPPWLDVALILVLAMVAPAVGLLGRPLLALAAAVAAAALSDVAAVVAFDSGLILAVVPGLVAVAVSAVGTLGLSYAIAAFERQRVRDTFARFVPADVVDDVLERTGDDLRLGGVRRDSTVLFSDIRGFTSYAEGQEPGEVVEVLNHYLDAMTQAIMAQGGTLVSFMGDGVMAVFGAPIEQPDHADRALAAAREMLDERLPAFNAWMEETGRGEGFRIGIGLNSGSVMSGQVGSASRMDYTTIGDTVNTASRLEGMTKGSGHQVFVADSTRDALVAGPDGLVLVGDREVRGRSEPIRVWTVPSGSAG